MLNYFCNYWRNNRKFLSIEDQKRFLAKCMVQDCEQSLSGSEVFGNHCRYLDSNGLCYAFKQAQVWCGSNSESSLCRSGGADWAVAPLGTAAVASRTSWTPLSEALLVGPAALAAEDPRYGCTCFKNCLPAAGGGLRCANGEARATGLTSEAGAVRAAETSRAALGRCACSCGGVAAA